MISRLIGSIGLSTTLATALLLGACASEPNKDIKSANEAKQEDNRDYQANKADLKTENRQDIAKEDKKIGEAKEELTKQRTDLAADVNGRLEKADIKAKALRAKMDKVPAPKRSALENDWTTYQSQRTTISEKSKTINTVPNESWNATKLELEDKLRDLERTVDTISAKF